MEIWHIDVGYLLTSSEI